MIEAVTASLPTKLGGLISLGIASLALLFSTCTYGQAFTVVYIKHIDSQVRKPGS
jgi:hypothetical protein